LSGASNVVRGEPTLDVETQLESLDWRARRLLRAAKWAAVLAAIVAVGGGVALALARAAVPASAVTQVVVPDALLNQLSSEGASPPLAGAVSSLTETAIGGSSVLGSIVIFAALFGAFGAVRAIARGDESSKVLSWLLPVFLIGMGQFMTSMFGGPTGGGSETPAREAFVAQIRSEDEPTIAEALGHVRVSPGQRAFVLAQATALRLGRMPEQAASRLERIRLREFVSTLNGSASTEDRKQLPCDTLYALDMQAFGEPVSTETRDFAAAAHNAAQRRRALGASLLSLALVMVGGSGAGGALAVAMGRRSVRLRRMLGLTVPSAAGGNRSSVAQPYSRGVGLPTRRMGRNAGSSRYDDDDDGTSPDYTYSALRQGLEELALRTFDACDSATNNGDDAGAATSTATSSDDSDATDP